MNPNEQISKEDFMRAGMAVPSPRGQLVPALQIEALPGGFVLTMVVQGDYSASRRLLVPNLDALVSSVQRWANEAAKETTER